MHRNENRLGPQRNVEALDAIAEGQEQRTVLEDTRGIYISKCRVMTRILNELEGIDVEGNDVRVLALELDADKTVRCSCPSAIASSASTLRCGRAIEHIGTARGGFRLNLPMRPDTARRLFAAISVDTTLPKKRRRADNAVEAERARGEEKRGDEDDEGNVALDNVGGNLNVDGNDPARNLQTVCAQTCRNYKSALKWWHMHHDPVNKGKVGFDWPAAVDDQINQQIKAYKRDIGMKKRRGVMRQKEGKSTFNLAGYIALTSKTCYCYK